MNTTPTPTLSELTEARTFVAKQIEKLEADRESLLRASEAPILDGTPYATVLLKDGRELIGGNWHDYKTGTRVNGFLDLDAVPVGLCGAFLSSVEVVGRRIAELKARGENAVAMHRRELDRRQLERTERGLRVMTDTLSGIDARIASIKPE